MSETFIRSYGRTKSRGKLSFLSELDKYIFNKEKLTNLNSKKLVLEIGFGSGEHLSCLAQRRECDVFIGAEPYMNGVNSLIQVLKSQYIDNVYIWDKDVRMLFQDYSELTFSDIYVLFPDPWHKRRHWKRRLVNNEMLSVLTSKLRVDGCIHIATDDSLYTQFISSILPSLSKNLKFEIITQDMFPDDWISTRYYRRAISLGNKITLFRIYNVGK